MGIFEKYEVDAAGGSQNSGKRKNFASLEVDRGKADDVATIGFEDYLTAKRNKQGVAGSFLKGFTHNFDDYAATINKAFGLKKGQEYWERQRKMNEVETQGHKLAHFGGEMLLDPVNLIPGGVFAEGAKAARIAKSAASGAALGAGMTVAHDYGRSDLKDDEHNERIATGAAMVGVLNGVIAALTKGKVRDAIKSPDDLASPEAKAAIDALANNPEAFGLEKAHASRITDEYNALLNGEFKGRHSRLPEPPDSANPQSGYSPDFQIRPQNVPSQEVKMGMLPPPGEVHPDVIYAGWKHSGETLPIEKNQFDTGYPGVRRHNVEPIDKWEEIAIHAPDEGHGIYSPDGTRIELEPGREKDTIPLIEDEQMPDDVKQHNIKASEAEAAEDREVSKVVESAIAKNSKSRKPAVLEFKKMYQDNPLVRYVVAQAKDRYAADAATPRKGGGAGSWIAEDGTVRRSGAKGDINPHFGASFNVAEYKKLARGEIDDELMAKLKAEISRVENDPMLADEVERIRLGARGYNGRHRDIDYSIAYDHAPTDSAMVGSTQGALPIPGLKTQNALFDTAAHEEMKIPKWAKPLVNDTTRYEDVVSALSRAKNGDHSELADRAIDAMKNDPRLSKEFSSFADDGTLLDANGNTLFANAGHHLAMGAGAGTINAFSGDYDPNRDLSTQIAEKFWEGMAAGMVGAQGLRMLRSRYPEAFEKVRNAVIENNLKPGDSVQLGMFAGQRAKGFKSAEEAGKVFPGKYDEMPRFEIDDSASTLKVPKTGAAYGTLEEVLDHPGLYENYPDLKDMDVRIDIDPTIQHGEARAHYQPYVDRGPEMFPITEELVVKARNRDEAHSALLHELQHAIQTREGFAGGANYETQLRHIDGDIYNKEILASRSALDAHNLGEEIASMKANRKNAAFDRYQRHAGEIEARDVQARQGLTPDEREVIPPYSYPDDTMWAEKLIDDPSYHAAKKAADEGRLLDKGAHGIDPEDSILDFSGSRADMIRPDDPDIEGFAKRVGKTLLKGNTDHLYNLVSEQVNKDWKDISNSLSGSLRRWFTDTYSGEYYKARDAAVSAKQEALRKAANIHYALSQLPEDARTALHEYIVGDRSDISPELRRVADNVKHTIASLQEKLIDAGISPDYVYAWGENYLKRSYANDFFTGAKRAITNGFKSPKLYSRGKEDILTPDEFARAIQDGEIDQSKIGLPIKHGGIQVDQLPNGKLRVKRDWTKEERESMGEITDAAATIPLTIMHLTQVAEHAKMLKKLADMDGVVYDPAAARNLTDRELSHLGYEKLPNMDSYGALAGQWVRKDVAGDIKGLTAQAYPDDRALQLWHDALRLWKKSKTVWNAPTHFNNLTANLFLMQLSGMNSAQIAGQFTKALGMMKKAARMKKLEQAEILGRLGVEDRAELASLKNELKHYKEAEEAGLLNTSFLEDINNAHIVDFNERSALGRLDDKLSNLYQSEDGVNKLAMYDFLRNRGWSKEMAREGVQTIMPDYSRPMAAAFRFMRETGIAPFIAWSYYTYPKMFRLLSTAEGATQAAKSLALLSAISGITTGIWNQYSDDLPDDFKMSRVPIARDGDKVTTVKLDRIIPLMQVANPVRTFKDTFLGSPWLTIASGANTGTKFYNGRPITNPHKSKAQQAWDYAKFWTNAVTPMPMQVMNGVDLIESLTRSKKNRMRSSDIVPRSTTQNALKFLGINTLTYRRSRAKKKNEKDRKEGLLPW